MSHEKISLSARSVLELIASGATSNEIEALAEQSHRDRIPDPDLQELDRVTSLGLRIQSHIRARQEREAGLTALVDAVRDFAGADDLASLLRIVARRARSLTGADMSCVAMPDDQSGGTYIRSLDGHISDLATGVRLPDGGHSGCAASSPAALLWSPDYFGDRHFPHDDITDVIVRAEHLRAVMTVPMCFDSQAFGTLYVGCRAVRHFTPDEISVLRSFGDLVGIAVERVTRLDRATTRAAEHQRRAERAEAEEDRLRYVTDVSTRLLKLVLAGSDIDTVTKAVSRVLGVSVRVCGIEGEVLASVGEPSEGEPDDLSDGARVVAHAAQGAVLLAERTWAAPIHAADELLGTLVMRGERSDSCCDDQVIDLVAQVMAAHLLLRRHTPLAGVQCRAELLDDLLASPGRPPGHLRRRAQRLGVDLTLPHVVVISRPEEHCRRQAAMWAASHTQRVGGLRTMRDNHVVLLVPGDDAATAAHEVGQKMTSSLGCTVTTSAAGPVADPGEVLSAYEEATRCLDAMITLGATGRAAAVGELGFLGVLLADNHDVEGFINSTIGPVLDHDKRRLTELGRTLGAYFDTGNSPTHAARRLHVHTNTVARRLDRIGELLGADWQRPQRSFEIQLALRLSQVRSSLIQRRTLSV